MRALPLCSFFFFTLTHLSLAQAAGSVNAQEKAAKKACAAGDFRKGVEILAGLYVDTDDATYIFNQGRCYEQNHQWVNATDRFREYLRKNESLAPKIKADVEKHIADCEALQEKETPKVAPMPVTAPALPPPPPMPAEQTKVVSGESAPPQENQGSGMRVAGIVCGSIGVAALATGLILNLKANSLASDFNRTRNPSTQSSQSTYKTGSMIGYGVGAGALVTGIVLYLIGHPSADPTPSRVSLLPVLTPAEFSLSMMRTF
jgi:hypothetical protein